MLRALLIAFVLVAYAEPAEACSPPACEVFLDPLYPGRDAGSVPTNVQLVAWVPDRFEAVDTLRLERLDGGDGDGAVPLARTQLKSEFNGCTSLFKLRPSVELLPNTDYRLSVALRDAGIEPFAPPRVEPVLFRTGDGPDLTPPAAPVVSRLDYTKSSCTSCGDSGGGASLAFERSDAVWFAPLQTRYVTNGGPQGFFVPFSCGIISPGLGEGEHEMPVVAFDAAWNPSEVANVKIATNCDGLDPCTRQPVDGNPSSAPLLGPSGCGCSSTATLLSLLAAAALARVLSRRR